MQYATIIEIKT